MSLLRSLNKEIQKRGRMSRKEIDKFCEDGGYRPETGRRRLELDESPDVEHIKKGGVVVEYRWKGEKSKKQVVKMLSNGSVIIEYV